MMQVITNKYLEIMIMMMVMMMVMMMMMTTLGVECGRESAPGASSPHLRHGFQCCYLSCYLSHTINAEEEDMIFCRVIVSIDKRKRRWQS